MAVQVLRFVCLAMVILGWIWNRRQWGFRGPKKLVDGEGLIFVGFVGWLIVYLFSLFLSTFSPSKLLTDLVLVLCITIGLEFWWNGTPEKDKNFGSFPVFLGVLALTFLG